MSAVIWIADLAFLPMAVTPVLRTAVTKEFVKPITDAFYKRYKRVIGALLVVILFTGGINLHYWKPLMISRSGMGGWKKGKKPTIFFIKLFLFFGGETPFFLTILLQIHTTV